MANLEGQILHGRYQIESRIGQGGMAEVYKAWDAYRQYDVAIKVIRQDLAGEPEFVRRFRQEAQALAALSHANIVRFYSFERQGPLSFIVMDYVEGITLRQRIRDAGGTPLPLDEVLSIARQGCRALHYAHSQNILHLDVKAANIMIRLDGKVQVTDFGLARAASGAIGGAAMPGTPAYMSPEQCRGEPLDARTDVYSFGVVVYEMLAGRRPFLGERAAAGLERTSERIRWQQVHSAPLSLQRANPALPRELDGVVNRALAKDPNQRWPTALAFRRGLESALERSGVGAVGTPASTQRVAPPPAQRPSTATSTPSTPPRAGPESAHLPRAAPRLPGWAWVLGGVVIVLVLVIGMALGGGPNGSPPPTRAQAPAPAVPFRLCVDPAAGGFQTEFSITVTGWQRDEDPRFRLTLARPDGTQTWEEALPDELPEWTEPGPGHSGRGFQITIKPEAGELPGRWQVTIEALPTGRKASANFTVTE